MVCVASERSETIHLLVLEVDFTNLFFGHRGAGVMSEDATKRRSQGRVVLPEVLGKCTMLGVLFL